MIFRRNTAHINPANSPNSANPVNSVNSANSVNSPNSNSAEDVPDLVHETLVLKVRVLDLGQLLQ